MDNRSDLDNKLDLIWITDMITDRITDKITDITSKLQMLITFAMVVRLRPTIYQNAHNSKENPWANSVGDLAPQFSHKRL